MQCKNHPSLAAVDRCVGCAEPFCHACLVEIHGEKYCTQCKVMALPEKLPAAAEQPMYAAGPASPYSRPNPYAPPQQGYTAAAPGPYASLQPQYRATVTCPAAKEALTLAIFGFFCCAILEIVALVKASEAMNEIAVDPGLEGAGLATAAQVISVIGLILNALAVLILTVAG